MAGWRTHITFIPWLAYGGPPAGVVVPALVDIHLALRIQRTVPVDLEIQRTVQIATRIQREVSLTLGLQN